MYHRHPKDDVTEEEIDRESDPFASPSEQEKDVLVMTIDCAVW